MRSRRRRQGGAPAARRDRRRRRRRLRECVVADRGRVDVLLNSAGAAHVPRSRIPRGGLRQDPDAESQEHLLHEPGDRAEDARPGQRLDHQHRVDRRLHRLSAFERLPRSKGGVVQATRSFALEWIDRGVRVNAIAPGLCDTQLLRNALAASGSSSTTDFIQRRMLRKPLIQPDELVAAAIFLAGDGAAKVTGHILAVDDGYLAQ